VFLLSAVGYSSPYWLTFRQARSLGGHVRKGKRALPVVFWSMVDHVEHDTGDKSRIPVLRYYSAFNVAQCDGLPAEIVAAADDAPPRPFAPIVACERVVEGMPNRPAIHHGFQAACYVPSADEVRMPDRPQFDAPAGYYATLFHELGHSTGHATRLARKGIAEAPAAFGSDTYGREELVAEMTSAYLCGFTGIEPAMIENAAAYVAGWLKVIRQDARLVVTAAAQAQKAADYIVGRTWNDSAAYDAEGGARTSSPTTSSAGCTTEG
jgi:antirestriction protein ArdC